jgi:hypothetical protein
MRLFTRAPLVCVLTLLAAPATAQPTIEDGIRAVLRGDYPTAVRILRPLADDVSARPDPVAQFFLAVLYHGGHGVAADQARACSLFLRAGTGAHAFAAQSAALAVHLRELMGGHAPLFCTEEESWQGGPPQTFVLGPGHRVVFADTSVSVTHGDDEQRTPVLMRHGATEFLPVQYTPLDVTRPVGARRHFFQWFSWTPDKRVNPSSWTLGWTLSEVVGDTWIVITGERELLVVNSPKRPESSDFANRARLRVNASGEAEFTIGSGISPRTEVIPWKGAADAAAFPSHCPHRHPDGEWRFWSNGNRRRRNRPGAR